MSMEGQNFEKKSLRVITGKTVDWPRSWPKIVWPLPMLRVAVC